MLTRNSIISDLSFFSNTEQAVNLAMSECRKLEHLLKMLQEQADRDDNCSYSDVLSIAISQVEKIHDQLDRDVNLACVRIKAD